MEINVKTKKFESLLEDQRQLKHCTWVYLEPINTQYEQVTIIITPKNEPLNMCVYLKKYAWKNEIDKSLNFAGGYLEVKEFLLKNKITKIKHIATN